MKKTLKISQFSRFLLRSGYAILVKIWQWLKLLNSVSFIKKTLVNHLYIYIWSFWLSFTALWWMKRHDGPFRPVLLRLAFRHLFLLGKRGLDPISLTSIPSLRFHCSSQLFSLPSSPNCWSQSASFCFERSEIRFFAF